MFYDKIDNMLKKLDKKYLVAEMIENTSFLEGNILNDYLYEIDKSMIENINFYKRNTRDFKEYIEMWCHEIKTPLATSLMLIANNKDKISESIVEEINKIDNYIEQVLYYARSNNANKDYIIKKTSLKNVVNNVIKRNKKTLINKKIKIYIDIKDNVYSDSKWLEFIVNQIITNSIKYSCNKITINSVKTKDNIILQIEDNGIGIEKNELDKVFEKGYTGTNGRINGSSTGIGLYLCKKLCYKLGHEITIDSKIDTKTIVTIIFPLSSLTNEVR